jgi:predicted acyl esterase
VRILFENGAGRADAPEAPVARFEASFDSFPPPDAAARTWYLGSGGELLDQESPATEVDRYRFDPRAGTTTFTTTGAYDFLHPGLKVNWPSDAPGSAVSYLSAPFASDVVVAGPGYADLWFRSESAATTIEVILTEVRTDGTEYLVQHGWLRAGVWKPDEALSSEFDTEYTFRQSDFQPLPQDQFTPMRVPITPVATVLRAGSRLRLLVNTPGRDTPLWAFENPDRPDDAHHFVSVGGDTPSKLVLPTVTGVDVAPGIPPCPSLRGQVCRTYVPYLNDTVGE